MLMNACESIALDDFVVVHHYSSKNANNLLLINQWLNEKLTAKRCMQSNGARPMQKMKHYGPTNDIVTRQSYYDWFILNMCKV